MITKIGSDILYHGSSRKVKTLKPKKDYGDSSATPVIYASPSKSFALAYGQRWSDNDMNQSYESGKNPKMVLHEMKPGAFDSLYKGKKGYLYSVPGESFGALPGMETELEVASKSSVTPTASESIPDMLKALRSASDVTMHPFDIGTEETQVAIKMLANRARAMEDGGKEYSSWFLKKAPKEVKTVYMKELGRSTK